MLREEEVSKEKMRLQRDSSFPDSSVIYCFLATLTLISGETLLKCQAGDDVSFKCPCCPEQLDSFRFKKLFKGGYIVQDGNLGDHNKFEFDEHKDLITLKKCHESDEGTYIWMCGKSNVNKLFHLEVLSSVTKSSEITDHLKCFIGDDITFASPCPEEVDSCTFKKQNQSHDVMRRGVLNPNSKYTSDKSKTHITLKGCNEYDKGTYVWMCGRSNVEKTFIVEINEDAAHLSGGDNPSKASIMSPQWLCVMVIKMHLFLN